MKNKDKVIDSEEKKFTQSELDEIVKNRLAREKNKSSDETENAKKWEERKADTIIVKNEDENKYILKIGNIEVAEYEEEEAYSIANKIIDNVEDLKNLSLSVYVITNNWELSRLFLQVAINIYATDDNILHEAVKELLRADTMLDDERVLQGEMFTFKAKNRDLEDTNKYSEIQKYFFKEMDINSCIEVARAKVKEEIERDIEMGIYKKNNEKTKINVGLDIYDRKGNLENRRGK